MRYRLIATDVDGTLVDHRQEIPARNLEAIRRFQAAGGLVTLATGRIEASAGPYLERVGANAPAILYNGGCIYDHTSRSRLYSAAVSPPVCQVLIDLLETDFTHVVHPILFVEGRPLIRTMTSALSEYGRKDGLELESVGALSPLRARPISKFLIIGDGEHLQRLAGDLHARGPAGLINTVRSEPTYLEVLPAGCTKGTALKRLADLVQVPLGEVIAIGDNLNDLEMVSVAGLGVAVANAHPDLKAAAAFVSPFTNEQAAVADVIERFCL